MRVIRDLLLLPIMRLQAVQKKMFGRLSQLHMHYRGSRLSVNEVMGRTPRVRAGERTPDVAFRVARGGAITTLFELLEPVRPLVLVGPRPGDDPARLEAIVTALADPALDLESRLVVDAAPSHKPGERVLVDLHGDLRAMYGLAAEYLLLVRPDGYLGLIQQPAAAAALCDYLDVICARTAVRGLRSRLGAGPAHG